jgi:sugar/nucleoside kinase (ribokinase family)
MYDIVGIGNAICDIAAQVEDGFLTRHKFVKGSMSLVDEEQMKKLLHELNVKDIFSGGSAANTIYYTASFGLKAAFIGRAREGYYGKKFADDMVKGKVNFLNAKGNSELSSAKSAVLVTPDGERTMCTYLGCAGEILKSDIDEETIAKAGMLYIEGYLWDQPKTIEAIKYAIKIAKENNVKIAFTLSDGFCVANHRAAFIDLFRDDIDILFANESEIKSLFEVSEFDHALAATQKAIIDSRCSICVITRSEKGAIVIAKQKTLHIPTQEVKVIDATGAGDAFAAGFLYAILTQKGLEVAADNGNLLAGEVISRFGARPNITVNLT